MLFKWFSDMRAQQLAIRGKLDAIPDREERKKAARKILSGMAQGQTLDAALPLAESSSADSSNWIKVYIRNAWQGKARWIGVFLSGFIIGKILNLIVDNIPALIWPVAIFALPFGIWFYVSVWRCAFNGVSRRWIGWCIRLLFIILPTAGLLTVLVLDVRQGVVVSLECKRDQAIYGNAIAANSDPKVIEEAKSTLDACNIQKEACFKDLDACREKSIP